MDTKTPVPFAMVMFFPASNQIGKFTVDDKLTDSTFHTLPVGTVELLPFVKLSTLLNCKFPCEKEWHIRDIKTNRNSALFIQ